jgi:glycosyltransferase involved in cell wall biosynthesis
MNLNTQPTAPAARTSGTADTADTADMAHKRRRILLSSVACSPLWGSEPGVGWQWLLQLVQQHEVVLLTHAYFRSHLEPALAEAGLQDLEVHYFQAPAFGVHPHKQLNSRVYYTWWQWRVRGLVQQLLSQRHFDVVHHLTWGTLRFPCFLGGLGVPLVMGPLGGGESAPLRLYEGLPLKVRAFDYLRSISLLWVRVDPLATWGPKRAALVLCKSAESLRALPASVRQRAVVVPEIGSPPVDLSLRRAALAKAGANASAKAPGHGLTSEPKRFQLLFAGRLLGWKGVALALGATARLVQAGVDVSLHVAGAGPLAAYLAQQVVLLGLQERVHLLGAIPREELLALYAQADLFVFPSLHDSSGNVVLEALSRGLPVVCLDLGGPQLYVDTTCGVVVPTRGLSRAQVEEALARAIAQVLADPARLASLSQHAGAHAQRQSWAAAVGGAYSVIRQRLQWASA